MLGSLEVTRMVNERQKMEYFDRCQIYCNICEHLTRKARTGIDGSWKETSAKALTSMCGAESPRELSSTPFHCRLLTVRSQTGKPRNVKSERTRKRGLKSAETPILSLMVTRTPASWRWRNSQQTKIAQGGLNGEHAKKARLNSWNWWRDSWVRLTDTWIVSSKRIYIAWIREPCDLCERREPSIQFYYLLQLTLLRTPEFETLYGRVLPWTSFSLIHV